LLEQSVLVGQSEGLLAQCIYLAHSHDHGDFTLITRTFAEQFAAEWIESWNDRNMERILSHYTDDFVMSSPLIALVVGEPSGTLRGKMVVAEYWRKALSQAPPFRFELVSTLVGADSVTIYYQGARGMVAEVFFFDSNGKVVKSSAHYA
jgi:hypothetical protein